MRGLDPAAADERRPRGDFTSSLYRTLCDGSEISRDRKPLSVNTHTLKVR